MDGVISREVNPMKKMECETILCTQCKVVMGRFDRLIQLRDWFKDPLRGFLGITRFEFKFWREFVFGLLS